MGIDTAWPEPELIGSLPSGCTAQAVTSDGHVVAFCSHDDSRITFTWDGKTNEPFLMEWFHLGIASVTVSSDGAHVAYMGVRNSDGLTARGDSTEFVGRDDTEGPLLKMISRDVLPTFDHAGRRLAYGGMFEGDAYERLIVDDEPTGGRLAPVHAAFSPDGTRLAYAELEDDQSTTRYRIVLDGEPGPWFRGLRNARNALMFSPDGRRFAAYTTDMNGRARWVVDGVPQRWINDSLQFGMEVVPGITTASPRLPAVFSPDSRRFAYFADLVEKGVAIVEDDVPGPPAKAVSRATFSPDSLHLAYVTQGFDGRSRLIVDGSVLGEWDAIDFGRETWSPDSRRIAVTMRFRQSGLFRKRRYAAVVIDGVTSPLIEGADVSLRPAWSPDGSHLAWRVRQDQGFVLVVDGSSHPDAPPPLGDVMYDARGRLIYLGLVADGLSVVVDGSPGPVVREVANLTPAWQSWESFFGAPDQPQLLPFRIAPAGHVAWAGVFEGGVRPVVDGDVGPAFDAIVECHVNDDCVTWYGQRGTELYRLARGIG